MDESGTPPPIRPGGPAHESGTRPPPRSPAMEAENSPRGEAGAHSWPPREEAARSSYNPSPRLHPTQVYHCSESDTDTHTHTAAQPHRTFQNYIVPVSHLPSIYWLFLFTGAELPTGTRHPQLPCGPAHAAVRSCSRSTGAGARDRERSRSTSSANRGRSCSRGQGRGRGRTPGLRGSGSRPEGPHQSVNIVFYHANINIIIVIFHDFPSQLKNCTINTIVYKN